MGKKIIIEAIDSTYVVAGVLKWLHIGICDP